MHRCLDLLRDADRILDIARRDEPPDPSAGVGTGDFGPVFAAMEGEPCTEVGATSGLLEARAQLEAARDAAPSDHWAAEELSGVVAGVDPGGDARAAARALQRRVRRVFDAINAELSAPVQPLMLWDRREPEDLHAAGLGPASRAKRIAIGVGCIVGVFVLPFVIKWLL